MDQLDSTKADSAQAVAKLSKVDTTVNDISGHLQLTEYTENTEQKVEGRLDQAGGIHKRPADQP